MDSRRFLSIIGLIGIALVLLACGRQESPSPAAQPVAVRPAVSGPQLEFVNFFSKDCPEEQFAVFADVDMTGTPRCEPPRACAQDADCAYLEIDRLPTRLGYCQNSTCVAICGSGVSRPCR